MERCGGVRRACAVRVCVLERACVCGAVRAPVCAAGCTVLCACPLCCAVLLLLMGSVLCVWRCAGVRRACAVRVCVLDTRVRLRCWSRAGVGCVMCCAVRLFTVLCGAGSAGRAARWAAARCGWLCAREMVCGGRRRRPGATIRSEESGTAPRGRTSRESKGPTGSSGAAERGRGERSDRGTSDGRENDEGRKTAGWHEG